MTVAQSTPAAVDAPSPGTTAPADFESLLTSVLPRAYTAARYLTGDTTSAEDLVQEAALLACKGFSTFQPGTNFRAWFLRILTNAFYMKCRQEQRRGETISLDGVTDLFLFSRTRALGLHETDPNPAATFLSRLETEQIVRAIGSLPVEYRAAATLHYVEDLTYEDVATVLGCPIGTVRSRLHRARKLLQVALWRIAEDHGLV